MKYLKSSLILLGICLLLAGCKEKCEHQYESQITKATSCTAEGEMTFSCTLCQHSYTEPIPALAHRFSDPVITKEPTCAEEGIETGVCTVCNRETTQSIEKTSNHILKTVSETEKASTCIAVGHGTGECSVCGATGVKGIIPISESNHNNENVYTKKPTCTEEGRGALRCTLCYRQESCVFPALGHTITNTTVQKEATCLSEGEQSSDCSTCRKSIYEVIPAIGHHTWTGTSCTCCSVCGTNGQTGAHTFPDFITDATLIPTDYSAAKRTATCTGCGYSKNIYYTKTQTIDYGVIYEEIANYAKSLGYNVCIANTEAMRKIDSLSSYVSSAEMNGNTQERFITIGKLYIDRIVDSYGNPYTEADRKNKTVGIQLSYTKGTASGNPNGTFYMGIYLLHDKIS